MKIRVQDNGDGTFTLLDPVEYLDVKTGAVILVPVGFTTDYASVPSRLQSFAGKVGRQNRAAIVHDWLYHTRGVVSVATGIAPTLQLARAECDRIFRDIMRADGVGWWTRGKMWLGVRAGGWAHWHFGERPE